MRPFRRPIMLAAANIVAIATTVGVMILLATSENEGLHFSTEAVLALYMLPTGIILTLVLLAVAGLRRETLGWAYASPIAVLALFFFLLAFIL